MSLSSPGFSLFAQLAPEKKKININVCIICQCDIDVKGSTKLTSVPEGRNHIVLTSRTLHDEFFTLHVVMLKQGEEVKGSGG